MNKLILSIGIALGAVNSQAQVVNIPDPLFKAALIAKGVDENNDGQIQIEEAALVTTIDIGFYYSIKNLEGIQAFSNLSYLNCINIQITKLDVSKNLYLTYLDCSRTQIDLLDVSKNTGLTHLNCSYTQISLLDVSKNTVLTFLDCSSSYFLTSLDVSQNINLDYLNCYLDNVSTICINGDQLAKTSSAPLDWVKNPSSEWSTSCGIITGIKEQEHLQTKKTLIRILTPLGQELQPEQATEGLFIYQYSDGSTRKVMKQN